MTTVPFGPRNPPEDPLLAKAAALPRDNARANVTADVQYRFIVGRPCSSAGTRPPQKSWANRIPNP